MIRDGSVVDSGSCPRLASHYARQAAIGFAVFPWSNLQKSGWSGLCGGAGLASAARTLCKPLRKGSSMGSLHKLI